MSFVEFVTLNRICRATAYVVLPILESNAEGVERHFDFVYSYKLSLSDFVACFSFGRSYFVLWQATCYAVDSQFHAGYTECLSTESPPGPRHDVV